MLNSNQTTLATPNITQKAIDRKAVAALLTNDGDPLDYRARVRTVILKGQIL